MEGLIVGFIAGVFGVAYFMYGKKQAKLSAMICGVLLCVYPYFVENVWVEIAVGALLLAVPFFVEY
jgi:hypothetical protein